MWPLKYCYGLRPSYLNLLSDLDLVSLSGVCSFFFCCRHSSSYIWAKLFKVLASLA